MIEIRSFRRVFDLERRIYSVDQLRLNPGGVPVRGVVYWLAIVAMCLIASKAPLMGAILARIPWYLRDLGFPLVAATMLSVIRIEGRTFHLAVQGLARFAFGPKRVAGARRCPARRQLWRPSPVLFLPDGSDSRMRRLRYTGPGAVLIAVTHERGGRARERGGRGVAGRGLGAALVVRESSRTGRHAEAEVIELAPGVRLLVRGSPGCAGSPGHADARR